MEPVMPASAVPDVLIAIRGWDPLTGPADDPNKWAKKNISDAVRRDVLLKIGQWPGGVECAYRDLAWSLGRAERPVYDALAELAERRVLLRVRSAGKAGNFYRLNPFLGDWRAMQWRTDPRHLIERIFDDGAASIYETVLVPRSSRGTSAVVPRPTPRRYEERPRVVPRYASRHYEDLMPREARGTTADQAKRGSPSSVRSELMDSFVPEPVAKEEATMELRRLRAKAWRWNGWRFFAGEPMAAFDELVAEHGHELVGAAIDQVAPDLNPQRWVETLALFLDLPADFEPAEPPAPAAPARPPMFVGEGLYEPPVEAAATGIALARARLAVTPPCDNEPISVGGHA
jgi:hypothetical protein